MRLVALLFLIFGCSPVALAEDYELAGKPVAIDVPGGFCALDRAQAMDRQLFAATEDVNTTAKYLLHAGPCDSLSEWRAGKSPYLPLYLSAVTPLFDGEIRSIGSLSRRDFLAGMKRALPAMNMADIQESVNEMYQGSDLAIEESALLGVVAEDENALYVALVGTVDSPNGEVTSAIIWATTVLNSIPVFVYLTDALTPGVYEALTRRLQPYLAELVRRNP
jgi:hypothetical protein